MTPRFVPTPATGDEGSDATRPVGLSQFLKYFLRLGTTGFGGPIATVGYMLRDLVEQRKWVPREEFLNGVALGQTMPGPLAAQVAMWVGYLQQGALGALGVAAVFILPSFIAVLTVAFFYVRYEGLTWVHSLFYGIAPGVMAIIAIAAVKLARTTNRREIKLWVISAVIMAVTAITGAEIAFLFIGAGLLMVMLEAPPRFVHRSSATVVLAHAGVHDLALVSAAAGTNLALGLFFLKAGAFIFGSGLAIVPFLREGVVAQHHWLTATQFLDAVAMGLITPGPVVITATFIGYLTAGFPGAVIATVAIFTPIYLGVVIPGRWFVRYKDNPQLKAFVRGATAAAAGAIGGATVVLTRQAVIDIPTTVIASLSLAVLWRFKIQEPFVVLACAVAGLILAR